jgi:nucleoside-diphosphate-sugar epimerase
MNILVTGADGFIGHRLVNRLSMQGYHVYTHSITNGDIAAKGALDVFCNIDHVFHLAARTFVPDSWDKPFEFYQTNVLGTVNALEFCRKNNSSMTFMSTYLYNEPQYIPIDEKHPVCPATPYHETKLAGESLCMFYARNFGVKCSILRPFNVYGKGQAPVFLLPKVLSQVLDPSIKEVTVMDFTPKRDYVYVEDVVSAMIATLAQNTQYELFNIGSGVSTSVKEAIQLIMHIAGIEKPYRSDGIVRKGEVSNCVASLDKIRNILGFSPYYSLELGLRTWLHEELTDRSI